MPINETDIHNLATGIVSDCILERADGASEKEILADLDEYVGDSVEGHYIDNDTYPKGTDLITDQNNLKTETLVVLRQEGFSV